MPLIEIYARRPQVAMADEGETPALRGPYSFRPSLHRRADFERAIQEARAAFTPDPARGVVERRIEGKTVLFPPESNVAFALDASSSEVWRRCDGARSAGGLLADLRAAGWGDGRDVAAELAETLLALHELRALVFRGDDRAGVEKRRVVDLRKVAFYVINLAEHRARAEFMCGQLGERGLRHQMIAGVKSEPQRIGIALSHLKILRMEEATVPFCILEDDCQFFDNFRHRLVVPASADALYLGCSRFGTRRPGALSWGAWDHTKYMRFDRDYLRPFNMLARHAVVFLSERYRQSAIRASLDALTHWEVPHPGDSGYAMLQTSHIVLTPNEPVCYQSERHRGNHPATKHPLRAIVV